MTGKNFHEIPMIGAHPASNGVVSPPLAELSAMVFHATHNAVMITDAGNRIVVVNRSFEQVTGYAAAEVQGKNPRMLSSGQHTQEFYAELWRSLNETGTWSGDMQDRHKDGHVYEKEVHITLLRDAAGQPAYHIAIFHDITQRKRFENSLREREQLLRTLIDSTPDFVLVKDAASRWLIANQAARQLYGIEGKDWLQRTDAEIAELTHPVHAASLSQCIASDQAAWQAEDGIWRGAAEVQLPHGGSRIFDTIKKPLFDERGAKKLITVIGRDITARARLERDLEYRASHDALTGLVNRSRLSERLEQALAQRQPGLIAVCVLDLDHFKDINDEYGHAIGDALLRRVGKRLQAITREHDMVARLGGDEFALVLNPVADLERLHERMQHIRQSLCTPFEFDGHLLSLRCSIGLALHDAAHPAQLGADALLRQADQAMYDAKKRGGDDYRIFDAARENAFQARQIQIGRLRQALRDQELRLYYQPKVDLRRGQVVGVEALLRWQHPEHGLLGPNAIFPLIENDDLIIDIGEWVTRSVIRQLADWRVLGMRLPVAINIASRHLQHPRFADRMLALCDAEPQLERALLEFEIVESGVLNDFEHVRQVIMELGQQGIRFALDDFGTGYSSLAYLKRIPADTLKIDQTFVRDMLEDESDLALVRGMLGLADSFGLKVVAEGVETEQQAAMLLQLGCDVVQGYGIARPMPAEQVLPWQRQFEAAPRWQPHAVPQQEAAPA